VSLKHLERRDTRKQRQERLKTLMVRQRRKKLFLFHL
jgi:hypothetical protein